MTITLPLWEATNGIWSSSKPPLLVAKLDTDKYMLLSYFSIQNAAVFFFLESVCTVNGMSSYRYKSALQAFGKEKLWKLFLIGLVRTQNNHKAVILRWCFVVILGSNITGFSRTRTYRASSFKSYYLSRKKEKLLERNRNSLVEVEVLQRSFAETARGLVSKHALVASGGAWGFAATTCIAVICWSSIDIDGARCGCLPCVWINSWILSAVTLALAL